MHLCGNGIAFLIIPVHKPENGSGYPYQKYDRNADYKEKGIVGGGYKI
jgi:hypothetical protein